MVQYFHVTRNGLWNLPFLIWHLVCVCALWWTHIEGGRVSGAHFNGWLRNTCMFELKFLINYNCINANTFWVPTTGVYIVGEVPIQVGSLEGGSHKGGSPRVFLIDGEHTSMRTSYVKISSFSFLHSFFLVFLNFPNLSPYSLCFEFSWSVLPKNLSIGTWERRDIAGSHPLHNSLGIFCWRRSLKIQREIKREVLTYPGKAQGHRLYQVFRFALIF